MNDLTPEQQAKELPEVITNGPLIGKKATHRKTGMTGLIARILRFTDGYRLFIIKNPETKQEWNGKPIEFDIEI